LWGKLRIDPPHYSAKNPTSNSNFLYSTFRFAQLLLHQVKILSKRLLQLTTLTILTVGFTTILRGFLQASKSTTPEAGKQTSQSISRMAWRSSGATNADLIHNLERHGLIKDERVKKAMLSVRKHSFSDSPCPKTTPKPMLGI